MSMGCPAGMESDDSEDELWNGICEEDAFDNDKYTSYHNGNLKDKKVEPAIKKVDKPLNNTWSQSTSTPKPAAVKMLSSKVNSSDMVDDMRVAAVRNNISAAKDYLVQGFKVDTVLKHGWSALMYACSCGNSDMVHLLLDNKANANFVSPDDMFTPLITICSSKQVKEEELLNCAQALTNAGADINAFDRHHTTALMFASREGRIEVVKHLLLCNASVDMKDNRGWTALFWAASRGHGQIVRLLLENKADTSVVSLSGQKASDLAHGSGFPIIGKVLENIATDNENLESMTKHLPDREERSTPQFMNSVVKYNELEMFLMSLNLQEFIPVFNDQRVDFKSLVQMDDEDLEKVGVNKLGVRQAILKAIASFHKKEWQKSSIPNLKTKTFITSEDIGHIIFISGQHLDFIDTSVLYIQKQLRKNPQILQLAKNKASVKNMQKMTQMSLKNCDKLLNQLNSLKSQLTKIEENVENLPVGLISGADVENSSRQGSWWTVPLFVAALGIFGFVLNREKINVVFKQHPWM